MTGVLRIGFALALCVLPRVAHGNDACADEAKAIGKTKDAALAPPTDKKAAAHTKVGNQHHRDAKKFDAVLKHEEAAKEYAAAIEEYIAAALIDSAPSLLYNLGQTYRASGQYEKAIAQYQLFLDRGRPGAALRALVECHIASMTSELERAAAGAPPSDPAPETTDEPGIGEPVATVTAPLGPDASRHDVPPWYADGLGWAGVGVGIVASGTGIVLLLDASNLRDEAQREERDDLRVALRDKADTRQTWGAVVGVVGVAALTAGVVKLILTPEARGMPASEEVGVSLWLAPSGLGLQGRF